MIVDAPKVSHIKETIVAIVRFGPPCDVDGLRPGEYFQVTINPHNFCPAVASSGLAIIQVMRLRGGNARIACM